MKKEALLACTTVYSRLHPTFHGNTKDHHTKNLEVTQKLLVLKEKNILLSVIKQTTNDRLNRFPHYELSSKESGSSGNFKLCNTP